MQGRSSYDRGDDELYRNIGLPLESNLLSLSASGTVYDRAKAADLHNTALISPYGFNQTYRTVVDPETGAKRDILAGVGYSVSFARDGSVFEIDKISSLLRTLPKPEAEQLRRDLVSMVSFTTEENRKQVSAGLDNILERRPDLVAQVEFLRQVGDFTRAEDRKLFQRELSRLADKNPGLTDIIDRMFLENLDSGDRWRPVDNSTLSISMGLDATEIEKLNNLTDAEREAISLEDRIAKLVTDPAKVRLQGITASEGYSSDDSVSFGFFSGEYAGSASMSTGKTLATLRFSETATTLRYVKEDSGGSLLEPGRLTFNKPVENLTRFNAVVGADFLAQANRGFPATVGDLESQRDVARRRVIQMEMEAKGTFATFMTAMERSLQFIDSRSDLTSDDKDDLRAKVFELFDNESRDYISPDRASQLQTDIGAEGDAELGALLRQAVEGHNGAAVSASLNDDYPRAGAEQISQIYLIGGEAWYIKNNAPGQSALVYTKVPAEVLRKLVVRLGLPLLQRMHGAETGLVTLPDPNDLSAADRAQLEAGDEAVPERVTQRKIEMANDPARSFDVVSIVENARANHFEFTAAEKYVLMEFFGPDATGTTYDRAALEAICALPTSDERTIALARFKEQVNAFRDTPFDVDAVQGQRPFEIIKSLESAEAERRKAAENVLNNRTGFEASLNGEGSVKMKLQHRAIVDAGTIQSWQTDAMIRAYGALQFSRSPTSLTDALVTSGSITAMKALDMASAGEAQRLEEFRGRLFEMGAAAPGGEPTTKSLQDFVGGFPSPQMPREEGAVGSLREI
ncbi:MAG: hypothetical protein RLO21_03180, partial [Nitratireductor sp.]